VVKEGQKDDFAPGLLRSQAVLIQVLAGVSQFGAIFARFLPASN
jgi:hypothetical protein